MERLNRPRRLVFSLVVLASCGGGGEAAPRKSAPLARAGELRGPTAFEHIPNREERSRALFIEATRVMLQPRCVNCHPVGDSPMQGDLGRAHDPPVTRGEHDNGVVGMECGSCHQDRNVELARVPGAPKWHLAPREMAWAGRSPSSLCEQLKDPKRNGNMTLAQIADHTAHDELVAWGWAPGHGRTPAPGSQATFGALVEAWVQTGAACPKEGVIIESEGPSGGVGEPGVPPVAPALANAIFALTQRRVRELPMIKEVML